MADQNSELMGQALQQLARAMDGKRENLFESRLNDSAERIRKTASESVAVNDAYGNSLAAIGTDDKVQSFTSYGLDNSTLNWSLWLALYNDSWVFRRAIDKPSQDMVNCGITIRGDQDYSKAYKAYARHSFDLIQLVQWGALFGGAVAVMLFEGIPDEKLKEPIDPKSIFEHRMRLYITDRWYGLAPSNETVTNIRDIDFGKPMFYDVTFADGTTHTVHHSRVLRYEGRTAPRLVKNGLLQGWGYAEGSHILNELARDDQLKSAITSLVNKSLIEVVKMDGMRGLFMGIDNGSIDQVQKRLEMVNWARTYNSLTLLDTKDEYIKNELSNISGLSQLLETNMWLVAASLEMQGVLFGDLKGGLSQESDAFKRYAVTILNRCNSYLRPVVQKFLTVVFMVYGIEGDVEFEFNSLVKDELNVDKTASIQNYSNMLDTLVKQGIINKYQAALSLQNFMNNGNISIDFDEFQLNKLKFEAEMEILATYKAAHHEAPVEILQSQFPEESNPYSGTVEAERRNAPNSVEPTTAETLSTPEETEQVEEE